MYRSKILISFLVLMLSGNIYSQETVAEEVLVVDLNAEKDTVDLDSAAAARKKAYEEQVKLLKEYERLRKKDPKRFRDSLNELRLQRNYDDALVRIEKYKGNTDLMGVKELDLSGARLDKVPDFVFKAKDIEVLVLDGNNIAELPERLNELKQLKRIYWRNNDLEHAKVKIARLQGIEKLDLSDNQLTRLPKVHRIEGIQELVLKENEFEKIPLWGVRRVKSLKELDISQNPVLLNRRWYWLINDLQVLKVNKSKIASIHPSIYKMKGLKELQLQVNELDSLPEGISRLSNLTKLSFYKNSLDKLPADFFDLKSLEVVDLYYNELQVIPSAIEKLDSLKILYVSFNKLFDIPDEIGSLLTLEELYIHHNRISEIPSSLSKLDKLKVLHFQNNYVPQFPSHILSMTSLEDLDISANSITDLPLELEQMQLKTFFWKELDINLNSPKNRDLGKMIGRMTASGITISPKVFQETVSEEAGLE